VPVVNSPPSTMSLLSITAPVQTSEVSLSNKLNYLSTSINNKERKESENSKKRKKKKRKNERKEKLEGEKTAMDHKLA
jgi:hypothetical protein